MHLPRQIRDPLLDEMETAVLGALVDLERERVLLSNIFILCALLANFIYGSTLLRFLSSFTSIFSRGGRQILLINETKGVNRPQPQVCVRKEIAILIKEKKNL